MEKVYSIAIDGPAGSGKSTIAKALAEKLGIIFLSTGSIYRALGYKCKVLNLDPKLEKSAEIVSKSKVECKFENGEQKIYLDENNISNLINNEEIGSFASLISQHKIVREKCVDLQRKIAKSQSMVIDGRDIGSVVLPNAEFKFYLDADVSVRAKRRLIDLQIKQPDITYDEVLADLKQRDYNDIHRQLSPLILCEDAVKIDSTNLSIEQVVEKFIQIINDKTRGEK